MRQGSAARLWRGYKQRRFRALAIFVGTTLLGFGLLATPAAAQAGSEARASSEQTPVCSVEANDTFGPPIGNARPVVAICKGQGLLLGYADEFTIATQEALQTVLVDMHRGTDRRVLLISLQSDGPPLLEDISGQISKSAGRGPMSSLEGIEIDVSGFTGDGMIAVRGRPEDNGGTARAGAINLGRQIAQVRSSLAARPAQD